MLLRNVSLFAALTFVTSAHAGDSKPSWPQDYERDVSKWQEVSPEKAPPKDKPVETKPLFPNLRWQVQSEKGKVIAQATANDKLDPAPFPPFKPRWKGDEMPSDMWTALPVDDGWIIAFDIGEFGAGVVWYNKDGSKNYEIAQEYIQVFLVTPDGIFCQGGCAHMGMSTGALSRLDKKGRRWELTHLLDTPARAPIQWLGNHSLVIVQDRQALPVYFAPYALRDWGRASFPFPGRVRVEEAELYASGQYVFRDSKLYTGGYGYVTELDLNSRKPRFLIPDSRFLNDDLRREISLDAAIYK
jgi:hypothetical protein